MPYPRKMRIKPPEGYISTADAMVLLDMSNRTFYKYKKHSEFPKPLSIGGRYWYNRAELLVWRSRYIDE